LFVSSVLNTAAIQTQPLLALVDTSPVLLLPSLLACRERWDGRRLEVALAGPPQADMSLHQLSRVLCRHGIAAAVHERGESLEATVSSWLASLSGSDVIPIVDVSSASGGTATRAVLATMSEKGTACQLSWFNEANNEVHFSRGGPPEAFVVDIGSKRSVRSAITPSDFMAIFGLERAAEDPYCGADHQRLVPIAAEMLTLAMKHDDSYREFRRLLAVARRQIECPLELTDGRSSFSLEAGWRCSSARRFVARFPTTKCR
jgi:hypothetical protein